MKKFSITGDDISEILSLMRSRSYGGAKNYLMQLREDNFIEDIFKEIDQAIEKTKSETPVPMDKSKFLIKLKEIKEKWMKI